MCTGITDHIFLCGPDLAGFGPVSLKLPIPPGGMSSSSSSASDSPPSTNHKQRREVQDAIDSDADTSDNESDSDSSSTPDNENAKTIPVLEDDGVPVLSHAARRKQKKQEKRKRREQEDDDLDYAEPKKKRKLEGGSVVASSKDVINNKGIKRQNSIWVGNMSFKTTEDNLRAFFKDRGVGEITRINMPTKAAKGPGLKAENRGCVSFSVKFRLAN